MEFCVVSVASCGLLEKPNSVGGGTTNAAGWSLFSFVARRIVVEVESRGRMAIQTNKATPLSRGDKRSPVVCSELGGAVFITVWFIREDDGTFFKLQFIA